MFPGDNCSKSVSQGYFKMLNHTGFTYLMMSTNFLVGFVGDAKISRQESTIIKRSNKKIQKCFLGTICNKDLSKIKVKFNCLRLPILSSSFVISNMYILIYSKCLKYPFLLFLKSRVSWGRPYHIWYNVPAVLIPNTLKNVTEP